MFADAEGDDSGSTGRQSEHPKSQGGEPVGSILEKDLSKMEIVDHLEHSAHIHVPSRDARFSRLHFPNLAVPDPPLAKFECIVCDFESKDFNLVEDHMKKEHDLVIGELDGIADVATYLSEWSKLWQVQGEKVLLTAIKSVNVTEPEGSHLVVGPRLEIDRKIRQRAQQGFLRRILDLQEKERQQSHFNESCPLCVEQFSGKRSLVLDHLQGVHNFRVGRCDDILNLHALLALLRKRIDSKVCIYCAREYKSRQALRGHMKKKNHMRFNPKDTELDSFYIQNYLEIGKSWTDLRREDVDSSEESEFFGAEDQESDEEWNGWQGDDDEAEHVADEVRDVKCLVCPFLAKSIRLAHTHALEAHGFDFWGLARQWKLSFYERVTLVNYLRRQMALNRCIHCDEEFASEQATIDHMSQTEGHFGVQRDAAFWKNAQYLIPASDSDPILFDLMNDDEEEELRNAPGDAVLTAVQPGVFEDVFVPSTSAPIASMLTEIATEEKSLSSALSSSQRRRREDDAYVHFKQHHPGIPETPPSFEPTGLGFSSFAAAGVEQVPHVPPPLLTQKWSRKQASDGSRGDTISIAEDESISDNK